MEITRTETVVVDTVTTNSYDDMVFTDKAGNERKIGNTRLKHFECIKPGAAVKLNFAANPHRPTEEYIYSAMAIEGKLPEPTQEVPAIMKATAKPEVKPDPKNRSFAIAYSKDLVVAGKIDLGKILSYAEVFDRWMSSDIVVDDEEVFKALMKKTFKTT